MSGHQYLLRFLQTGVYKLKTSSNYIRVAFQQVLMLNMLRSKPGRVWLDVKVRRRSRRWIHYTRRYKSSEGWSEASSEVYLVSRTKSHSWLKKGFTLNAQGSFSLLKALPKDAPGHRLPHPVPKSVLCLIQVWTRLSFSPMATWYAHLEMAGATNPWSPNLLSLTSKFWPGE